MTPKCKVCGTWLVLDSGDDVIEMGKLYGRYDNDSVFWTCNACVHVSERIKPMNNVMSIGETVEHGGQKFVIVDIKHHATMDGVMLIMTAYDPNMADKEQQKQIKMDQTSQNMIEMLKKLTEGGGLDFGGFKLGGS